jgi:hypothetical protein
MIQSKKSKYNWLRWIAIPLVIILWVFIASTINGKLVSSDESLIQKLIETFICCAFITGISVTGSAIIAPSFRKGIGMVVGFVVLASLIFIMYYYLVRKGDSNIIMIVQFGGLLFGYIMGLLTIRQADFFKNEEQ